MDAQTVIALSTWLQATATGLVYVGLAFAVYLTFRVLDFPDLTVNGSVSLGAVTATALVAVQGWNPWAALPVAVAAGVGAGLITGLLHTALRINGLLASILVTLGLYSVNLRLLGGKANLGLYNEPTIYDTLRTDSAGLPVLRDLLAALGPLGADRYFRYIVLGGLGTLLLVLAATWWLHSEQGLAVRATGDNPQMIRALGASTERMKLLGLAVANGAAALTGALLVQSFGFYDISLGSDAIIIGLAGVIIGEALVRSARVGVALAGLVLGSVLYQIARAAVLEQRVVDVQPTDLQIATALLVITALALPILRGSRRGRAAGATPASGGRTP